MSKQIEILTARALEILNIMSHGDFDETNSKKPAERLLLALTNHRQYVENFPDDEWITEGYDIDANHPKCSEKLFAWALTDLLTGKIIIGDKGDELYEAAIEVLRKYDIEIEQPQDELNSWPDYEKHLNAQLVDFGKKIMALGVSGTDDLILLIVDLDRFSRLVELSRFFNLEIVLSD